jgi:AraC-like DNA-binding protein
MFVDFILIAGMSLLGLNILFLAKSRSGISQKMLIVFFANAIFFLLYYYSFLHKVRLLGAIAMFFGHGVGFLLGPMLLFQLKSLILPREKFIKSLFRHLIPFGLVWLFISVPVAISMATPYFKTFGKWYAQHDYYVNIPENVFFMVYIALSLRLLKKIHTASQENSSADKNNLNWYKHLLIGFAAIVVLDTLCTVYELFFPMIPWNIGTIIAFGFVLMYVYLGYKGMFQAKILLPDFLLERLTPNETKTAAEEQRSVQKNPVRALDGYSHAEIEQLKKDLYHTLETNKLYLNENLSISDLAEELGVSTKKLSELLNQHLDTNFYNLINHYRVNEVIARLSMPDAEKYNLLGIAYECGFQSKASFNRIFKQKTGHSPSAYRKQRIADMELADENLSA